MEVAKDFVEFFASFNAIKGGYLIANKRASGRKQDLLDLDALLGS